MTDAASAAPAAAPGAAEVLPKTRFDAVPLLLMGAIALAAWPATGSTTTWLTLTFAGLAMGMIVFIAASGLTLVFGLMDVLNFGHS
ncbi:MAG: branched-chain amino acid ABC transporter permease, partial [Caldimonas sp.]